LNSYLISYSSHANTKLERKTYIHKTLSFQPKQLIKKNLKELCMLKFSYKFILLKIYFLISNQYLHNDIFFLKYENVQIYLNQRKLMKLKYFITLCNKIILFTSFNNKNIHRCVWVHKILCVHNFSPHKKGEKYPYMYNYNIKILWYLIIQLKKHIILTTITLILNKTKKKYSISWYSDKFVREKSPIYFIVSFTIMYNK